ncbi:MULTISPECIES: DUF1501 domain-containing protein [Hyphobacterium]|uniref:DUF1501 domain-containing protein n=1 Tax=Hyphobacterium vulgare TaxID=1736751 RepID=A0ABV7A1I6_9PROT
MSQIGRHLSRRAALRGMAACCAGAGTPFAFNLLGIGAAAQAQAVADYKALVCIFLFGGNDQSNTVIPREGAAYSSYAAARPTLARPSGDLVPLTVQDWSGPALGLPPELSGLAGLFNTGRMAIVANTGTLLYPTTQAQILNGSVALPRQLFSHSDQQNSWQTGLPDRDSRSGWLGRIGDVIEPLANGGALAPICMSVAGNNVLQAGDTTVQYQLTTNGPVAVRNLERLYGVSASGTAYRSVLTQPRTNLLEAEYTGIVSRAIATETEVTAALAGIPALTTGFPQTRLGAQMGMIARMIAARSALGQNRQVFFAAIGGWDFHDNLLADQANRLTELGDAMAAFNAATEELGVAPAVTTFTASDFGRALQYNGRGSDHGWGAHHFVMGGAVRGGRVFGRWPDVALGSADDAGQGRLIPTTSVDEYAAELAGWFGVPPGMLSDVIPHVGRFDRANMDFLT